MEIKNKTGHGFDIVSNINRIFPENVEFHTVDQGDDGIIRQSSFTGPNTNLKKRLDGYIPNTGKYNEIITQPINKLDRAAMEHDLAYSRHKDLNNRHDADKTLITVAHEILNDPQSTKVQKFNAGLVILIMESKIKLGIGYGAIYGGNIDVNQLIKQAQQNSQSTSFQGNTDIGHVIAPLLFLASSVGIPAVIALLGKKNKKKE